MLRGKKNNGENEGNTWGRQSTRTTQWKREHEEDSWTNGVGDAAKESMSEPAADGHVENIEKDPRKAIALDEKIAAFFEDRPFFYDVSHGDYKNKQRKDAELAEFAAVIGCDAVLLWKRFCSIRTDYGKLKNPNSRKSVNGKKLTNLQNFKLTRYKFLDAHITPRTYSKEMGNMLILQDPSPQASYSGDGEDYLCYYGGGDDDGADNVGDDDSARPGPSNNRNKRASSPEILGGAKRFMEVDKKPEVVDLLSQMMEDNRRTDTEAEKKSEAMAAEKLYNERDTWGSWLKSAAQGIPATSWRSFQRDTFEVALRYLPPDSVSPSLAQHPHHFQMQQPQVQPHYIVNVQPDSDKESDDGLTRI